MLVFIFAHQNAAKGQTAKGFEFPVWCNEFQFQSIDEASKIQQYSKVEPRFDW